MIFGLVIGIVALATSIWCFVYSYRTSSLALLPVAIVLLIAGSFNVTLAVYALKATPNEDTPDA